MKINKRKLVTGTMASIAATTLVKPALAQGKPIQPDCGAGSCGLAGWPGVPIRMTGTEHIWVFGDAYSGGEYSGTLHWVGDTRALAGRSVLWNHLTDLSYMSFRRLRLLRYGDPWLSAGLLKDGDPIYLVKWETDWPQPELHHIQSIEDVELFGINADNYGRFVLDRANWEAKYGFDVDSLERKPLEPATWGSWKKRPDSKWPGISLYDVDFQSRLLTLRCEKGGGGGRRIWINAGVAVSASHVQVEARLLNPPYPYYPPERALPPMQWKPPSTSGWIYWEDVSNARYAHDLFEIAVEGERGQRPLQLKITSERGVRTIELHLDGLAAAARWLQAECD